MNHDSFCISEELKIARERTDIAESELSHLKEELRLYQNEINDLKTQVGTSSFQFSLIFLPIEKDMLRIYVVGL